MQQTLSSDFDFEMWKTLASTDPSAFEARRKEEIQRLLNKSPESVRRRLNGLQWRIDMERRKYSNPMASCVHIFDMMWEAVYGDQGLLESLQAVRNSERVSRSSFVAANPPAMVVDLKSRMRVC